MTLYFAHSVISRLVRRLLQETKSPKSQANTLVFESLEPRLLLAADPLGITVIEANGSTQLTEVGDHFFLYDGSGSGPSLKYAGADYVAGQFGAWAPIAAEQTASGYEVAWQNGSADQYTVWNTDSSGNHTSQTGAVSGADYALQSLEPSFHQDLNGDGQVGPPTTVIEANGSTQLTEVGDHFFLYDGSGSGPSLKYAGADYVAGQFGPWAPIAAEQTANGYEVAWKVTGIDQYIVWNTDSSGNHTSQTGVVSGADYALQSLEPSFHQDLNGDGPVGPPTTVIEANGSTQLTEVGDHFFLYDGSGSGPSLKYAGADYVAGQFSPWAPIAAEQTANGYEVAWKVTGVDQYSVWNTDSSGNYITNLVGAVSGADYALQSLEPSFHQDLNGDGQVGPPTTVALRVVITAPTDGSTLSGTVTITANVSDNVGVAGVQFYLDGALLGTEDITAPYSVSWNTTTATNASHTLLARASDAAGNITNSPPLTVTVHGTNDAPTLAVQTGSQNANVGSAFSLVLPAGTFTDVDAGDSLTYTATAADGSSLPAWLSFNAATRTFGGTPTAGDAGTLGVKVSATDLGGLAASETFNIVVATRPTTVSLFTASNMPAQINLNDGQQLEVGVKFQSFVAGQITALKFYRSPSDTSSDLLDLWTSTGTNLASVTFTNTGASGWQSVNLATPVAISANTTYVASYHTSGFYVATDNFFTAAFTSGVLTAPFGNGVYAYGGTSTTGIFPTNTFGAANYWVDVVFASSAPNTAPTAVADTTPASGNVLTNDTDPDAGDTKTVTAVSFGTVTGTLGMPLAGAHGSLVLNASGAFTYTVDETDPAVQALRQSTDTVTDVFSYTMRDTAGATSTTTLTVTVSNTQVLGLPADRLAAWNPGLNSVGGIPNRTTVFTTVYPGGDIQAAIDACPPGQVVQLAAGTWTVNNYLLIDKGITLRGTIDPVTHAPLTFLEKTNGATAGSYTASDYNPIIIVGPSRWPLELSTSKNLTSDAVAGTYSVTLASTAGLSPGQFVILDEDDYTSASFIALPNRNGSPTSAEILASDRVVFMDHSPSDPGDDPFPDSLTWFSRMNRPLNEIKEIASVNGNTVTFTSPITITYTVSKNAQLTSYVNTHVKYAGIENLSVKGGSDGQIRFEAAAYSWMKNVEDTGWLGEGVAIVGSFRIEVRDSYIHHGAWPEPGGGGYAIGLAWASAEVLIENNIILDANKMMVGKSAGAGTVVAYNYTDDGHILTNPSWQEVGISGSHMVGSHHWLFEGNESFNYDSDNTHGNAIDMTVFRNHLTGDRTDFPNPEANARAVGLMFGSWWHSIIGNVLGNPGQMAGWGYENPGSGIIWEIGYDPQHWEQDADPKVKSTLIRGGNYDYLTNSVHWENIAPQTLPNSLYLSVKPAFFGSYTWPWVDPTGSTQLYILPAKARYDAGKPFALPPTGMIANNDSGLVASENTALSIPASTLLANDTDPNGLSLSIVGVSNPSNGTVSYNASTQTVSFAPNNNYLGPASFTYTITDGQASASANVSLTVNYPITAQSLFNPSDTPATVTANDPNSVELGVKFQASTNGTITGIRFYKGPQNTGTHVADLWSATGTLLATATFTNETASGWQQVNLANPVVVTAGTTYVVSYHTSGYYSATSNYFATAHTNGSLTALASGTSGGDGVYAYGTGSIFPTNSFNASNYWVDVVFNGASL